MATAEKQALAWARNVRAMTASPVSLNCIGNITVTASASDRRAKYDAVGLEKQNALVLGCPQHTRADDCQAKQKKVRRLGR